MMPRPFYQSGLVAACIVALMLSLFAGLRQISAGEAMEAFEVQRRQMVAGQISARGVTDPAVVAAMSAVPRHRFVPKALWELAYTDQPLPIGFGQTISQPYIVAKMTELLAVNPDQRVLEVGTGSGYQAAVLAELGVKVFTIEIVSQLGRGAEKTLADTGYGRVQVKIGDGYKGWPEHAPFDGIIVTCAPSHIPQPLKDQLAEDGRLVIPVGPLEGIQQLVVLRKTKGKIIREKVFDVRFVPMKDQEGKPY